MKILVGQQVGFKLKRKRCVKSAISNHGFQLVSMKKISHLVLYCYVLLTVFIVCLGSIKDIVFIIVSCVSLFRQIFFKYSDCVRDRSLFIAWGGSEDFGLNTMKFSRSPL